MTSTISRDHVAWNRRVDSPLRSRSCVSLVDGMWCNDCPSLACWAARATPTRDRLSESEFAFLWDEIASESDDARLPHGSGPQAQTHRLGRASGKLLDLLKARTFSRDLTSKGFDEVNRGDIFDHFIVNGKKSGIHTMMSHGETTAEPGT